jgi:hypothetical protein
MGVMGHRVGTTIIIILSSFSRNKSELCVVERKYDDSSSFPCQSRRKVRHSVSPAVDSVCVLRRVCVVDVCPDSDEEQHTHSARFHSSRPVSGECKQVDVHLSPGILVCLAPTRLFDNYRDNSQKAVFSSVLLHLIRTVKILPLPII